MNIRIFRIILIALLGIGANGFAQVAVIGNKGMDATSLDIAKLKNLFSLLSNEIDGEKVKLFDINGKMAAKGFMRTKEIEAASIDSQCSLLQKSVDHSLDEVVIVRCLQESIHADALPVVLGDRINTYAGKSITIDQECFGTLSMLFERDPTLGTAEKEILGILLSAIAVEENRRRADDALRANEEQMLMAQQMGHTGAWAYDLGTKKIWASVESRRLFGFAPGDGYLSIDHIGECLPERDRVFNALRALIHEGRECILEYQIKPVDGSPLRILHSIAKLERQPNGRPLKVLGFIQDITERKRTEEKSARLAAIVDSSDDIIISKTLDGIVTSWNRGAEIIYGYTQEEMIGKSVSHVLNPDRPDERPKILENLQKGLHTSHYETVRRTKDGRYIDVSLTISPIYDTEGNVVGTSTIGRDIGERKVFEALLRESEERYRAVTESAHDAIITVDSKGFVVNWSGGAENMFGYTKDEMVGIILTDIIPFYYCEYPEKGMVERGEERLIGRTVELQGLHKSGRQFPLELSLAVWETVSGKYFTGIIRDITLRKRMESEMRKLSRAMEQSPSSIVITDLTGAIEYVNPRFTKVIGYVLEDVLGKNPNILKSGETTREEYADLWNMITSGKEWRGEFHNKKRTENCTGNLRPSLRLSMIMVA